MLSVVHNYYYSLALLIIHSLRTSICVCKYLYMLSATFDDRGGGANDPPFSVDLTRSRAIFRDPEILYIIRRTCCTSQGDPDSSFPYRLQDPQKAYIFYAIHFHYIFQKKSQNKLCLEAHDTYVLFRTFFSHINIK